MKNKYIIIREKPYNIGVTVAQINVSYLSKKQCLKEMDSLIFEYPIDKYCMALCETNNFYTEFKNVVEPPINFEK